MGRNLTFKNLGLKRDFEAVRALLIACNDYVIFEQGTPTDDAYVTAYFCDCPSGQGPVFKHSIGVFDGGNLVGLVDLLAHYPKPDDWYLGFLLLTPQARSNGVGSQVLRWVVETAKAGAGSQLRLCVLAKNTAGRRFWEREGFTHLRQTDPIKIGKAKHIKHELVRTL